MLHAPALASEGGVSYSGENIQQKIFLPVGLITDATGLRRSSRKRVADLSEAELKQMW